jgi:hypothetical protein
MNGFMAATSQTKEKWMIIKNIFGVRIYSLDFSLVE